MTINLSSGDIYFIGEIDVRTNELSPYYKIGLVHENDDKGVDQRISQHQTGNPRQLILLRSIKTACVSKVETFLHRSFATLHVSGEWFELDSASLRDATSLCETLSLDASRRIPFVQTAATVSKELSNGQSIEPTHEQSSLHKRLLTMRYGSKLCNQLAELVVSVLDDLTEGGSDTSLYLTRQNRKGKMIFNERLFLENHPNLHAKFLVTSKRFKANSFTIADVGKFTIDPGDIDPIFGDLYQRIHNMANVTRREELIIDEFYELYLEVLGHEVRFEWESHFAEAELKSHLGLYDEINGVCKWRRGMVSETKFDKSAFSQEYPELYTQFSPQAAPGAATVLHKGRGAIGVNT